MKKVKISGQRVRTICAAAMALTLAVPTTLYVNATPVEAADSILGTAIKTYDFESEAGLSFEGEKQLKLENDKPVLSEDGKSYEMAESTALPKITEDSQKGKVLTFEDSADVKQYVKTQEDAEAAASKEGKTVSEAALNIQYPVGSVVQQEERLGGRVKVDNPFKGLNLPYEGGVSISYWVKVPEIYVDSTSTTGDKTTADNKNAVLRGANSTTVVFNNADRTVMNKDDYVRYLACQAYDEAAAKNDEKTLKDYALGDYVIANDAEGNAYVVYKNVNFEVAVDSSYNKTSDPKKDTHYGKLIRFNPDYPSVEASNAAASAVTGNGKVKQGGWIVPNQAKDGKIDVTFTDENGKEQKLKICSLSAPGQIAEDENQYQYYKYRYAKTDDKDNGFYSKSKVREGTIKGSLQITTDNDFGFRADNYRTKSYTDSAGNVKSEAIDGVRLDNPNRPDYDGKIIELDSYNQLFFDGDEFVTETANTWHYVTIVMQNDWVVTYVDGVAADPEIDYTYMKTASQAMKTTVQDFSKLNTGKTFNKGKGLRKPFNQQDDNVSDWSSDGTAQASPANSLSITMLDWITDNATELYFGGTGFASECLTQGFGTVKDVCMDDVSFFGKALTEDEAIQLYDEAVEKAGMAAMGDVNMDGEVDLTDVQLALQQYLGDADLTPSQLKLADMDGNDEVDLTDVQAILIKYLN